MRVLICPDKFKGSISAEGVCTAIKNGLLSSDPQLEVIGYPMADGGDGSIEILKPLLRLEPVRIKTFDPLGRAMDCNYYVSDDAAFIELASASGIVLLEDDDKNPFATSTRGTGIMMKDAIERGFHKINLFIGGSATNDGGIGIAQALGFNFLDKDGKLLEPIGGSLEKIHKIENNNLFNFDRIEISVLCDVLNPMYGSNGAAHVYGAQKGASSDDIVRLDKGLENYSSVLKAYQASDLSNRPGMGAAGAVGASLVGLLNAKLENGFQMLANITNLKDAIRSADLVITGEGKIDSTSFQGKVVGNVLDMCEEYDVPCGVVGGSIDDSENIYERFVFNRSIISRATDLMEAMTSSAQFLNEIGKDIGNNELNSITIKN